MPTLSTTKKKILATDNRKRLKTVGPKDMVTEWYAVNLNQSLATVLSSKFSSSNAFNLSQRYFESEFEMDSICLFNNSSILWRLWTDLQSRSFEFIRISISIILYSVPREFCKMTHTELLC